MAGVAPGASIRAASAPANVEPPDKALVLIGFMGAGKSTVARLLASALGACAQDSDALLEQRFGHSIAREFELRGETSFREAEESLVCELLAAAAPGDVIALGGGAVLSARVRAALSEHLTIFLDVDPALAWQRLGRSVERPLAHDRDAFIALAGERQDLYEQLADAYLPAPDRGVAGSPELAGGVLPALRALSAAPSGARMVWAWASSGEYPVLVGRGLIAAAREGAPLAALWPLDPARSRPYCITDEIVGGLYGARLESLGSIAGTIAIDPGERHKTLASAELVWSALVAHDMTRSDHLVALGGGVVGDLAGFCAATYQRGIPIVHVPTTLVAQVDSAYGGKTGVDLPDAKNYVGAYHQPAGVLCDPDTLATLPAAELAAGWVEVLKTALIAGGPLWERVATGAIDDEQTILDCVRTKLAVVAADERDGGRRQVLNLGHTVGHAIETVSGYARYRHGEAVGLGLLTALRLSGAEHLREQVRELLLAHELPVVLDDNVDPQEVVAVTARDKKRLSGGSVPFVLLCEPGQAEIGCAVAAGDLLAAVRELAR